MVTIFGTLCTLLMRDVTGLLNFHVCSFDSFTVAILIHKCVKVFLCLYFEEAYSFFNVGLKYFLRVLGFSEYTMCIIYFELKNVV